MEPAGAQTLAGLAVTHAAHKLQGAGYAMIPPQWDAALCDGTIPMGDDEAISTARELARREGILAGFSTGANGGGALRLAAELPGLLSRPSPATPVRATLSTDLFASD